MILHICHIHIVTTGNKYMVFSAILPLELLIVAMDKKIHHLFVIKCFMKLFCCTTCLCEQRLINTLLQIKKKYSNGLNATDLSLRIKNFLRQEHSIYVSF